MPNDTAEETTNLEGVSAGNSETSERVKRPDLPRSEPIRSWSTLFGAESTAARAQQTHAAGTKAASDAVQRGVELGYRVMDEYVRQGTAAAEAFTRPERQGVPYADLTQMSERMVRTAQDFTSMWFDMMGSMMNMAGQAQRGAPGANGASPWAAPFAPVGRWPSAGPQANLGRSRVVLRIESNRPTETIVTFDDSATTGEVVVEPLRGATSAAQIGEVAVSLSDGAGAALRLMVRVPPEVPADRYTGALLEAGSKTPKGRVTITVLG